MEVSVLKNFEELRKNMQVNPGTLVVAAAHENIRWKHLHLAVCESSTIWKKSTNYEVISHNRTIPLCDITAEE